MKSRLSDELTMLTTKLMMCGSKREIIGLSNEFGKLIERVIEQENKNYLPVPKQNTVTATVKFSKEEVANMAKTFKKEFIANGLVARVIKRQSGKKSFLYEIRYRRNGYNISASSTDLKEAKRRFLEMTKPENIDKYAPMAKPSGLHLFKEVCAEWLEYKKGKVKQTTLDCYESYARRYIFPSIGDKPIAVIRTIELDKILNDKTPRLYEDLRTVFNSVFKYALNSGLITHNPVALVPFKRAERQNRRALTKDEQLLFIKRLSLPEFEAYRQAFLIMYYFGLRPCELEDAHFEGDFLIARNAKRKGGKIEYKKIPVPIQARGKLDITAKVEQIKSRSTYTRTFKKIMNDEDVMPYYLRHTFATTCQQYVRPDIVDIWMGDSPQRLVGRVYTHFPDDFMQAQMNAVSFEI